MNRRLFLYGTLLSLMPKIAAAAPKGLSIVRGQPVIDESKKGKLRIRVKHKHAIVTLNKNAFLISPDTEVFLEQDEGLLLETVRLVSGAIHSTFDPSQNNKRSVATPHATIAIRGTAQYTEIQKDHNRTYSCCCYGHIRVSANQSENSETQKTTYHDARVIEANGEIAIAPYNIPLNHYDNTLEYLESLNGRKPRWERPDPPPGFISPFEV